MKDSVILDRQMELLSRNDKGKDKLLQQKGFLKSLFNKGNISIGRETIMSHMKVHVIVKDREKLACQNGQEKIVEQMFGTVTVMEDQNSILMKDSEAISQINWVCDKGEDNEYCTEFRK